MADPSSAQRYLLRVLLWLPVTFAAWYISAPLLMSPIAIITNIILDMLSSYSITVQQQVDLLVVEARHNLAMLLGSSEPFQHFGRRVSFIIKPLQYFYGLPLVVGMTLAAPGGAIRKIKCCGIVFILLIPVQLLGVCSQIFYMLASSDPSFTLGVHSVLGKLLGIACHFSFVILPMVTPVIVWALVYRDYLRQLAGGRRF